MVPSVAMVKKERAAKTPGEKAPARAGSVDPSPTPEEGARLIRAFVAVKDPRVREAILAFVEKLV